MRQALGRIKIPTWIALLIMIGPSFWLIKVIRYQSALSSLYITKDACKYSPRKSVTVFLDDRAQKELRGLHITASDIIAEANKIFAENKLPFRYADNRKIRTWNTEGADCKFSNAGFLNERRCFINEMRPRYRAEQKNSDPDVLTFITATGINDMSGKSYWNIAQGNGTIVLNLGMEKKVYDPNTKLGRVARNFFMRRFAQMLIHEQAHLYGAPHVSDGNSIMKANTDNLGSHKVRFDQASMEILISRNKELNIRRNTCAAQP